MGPGILLKTNLDVVLGGRLVNEEAVVPRNMFEMRAESFVIEK